MTHNAIPKPRLRRGPHDKWHCRCISEPHFLGVGSTPWAAYEQWLWRWTRYPAKLLPEHQGVLIYLPDDSAPSLWARLLAWLRGAAP